MLSEYKEKKLIELFVSIDDFCQALEHWKAQRQLGVAKAYLAQPVLADSEALTLLVFYGTGHPALLGLQMLSVLLARIGGKRVEKLLSPFNQL